MITLGAKARDKVTRFEGIVTAHCRYITGCDQYAVTPPVGVEGKLEDARWFDELRLEVTDPIPMFVDPRRAADVQAPG